MLLDKGGFISIRTRWIETILCFILTFSPAGVVSKQDTSSESNKQLNSPTETVATAEALNSVGISESLGKAQSVLSNLSKNAASQIKKQRTTTLKTLSLKPGIEQWRAEVSKYNWNVEQALSVMSCESGGNQTSKNSKSTASGLFQIIEGTWKGNTDLDWLTYRFDGVANISVAYHIWSHRGWSPWSGCVRF